MEFPQFRSLNNNQVIYKINSENEFVELKITGKYYSINKYIANQYPEKLKIREMITNANEEYVEITQFDFNEIKLTCESSKKLVEF